MTLHTTAEAVRNEAIPLPAGDDLLRQLPEEVVPIGDLLPSFSPRERHEDPAHVRRLAETGGGAEPLLVHRPTMRVIDGMHRLRAATMCGWSHIAVRFFDGSEADAFVLAVQLNVRHGLPLTLEERRAAARRIIASHPDWSDRAIAERVGLSSKTVGKVRREAGASCLATRLGRDGRLRPASSVEGRRSAAVLLAGDSQISLRELSRKTGLSVGTVRDVRDRLDRGQDPVPDRLRGQDRRASADGAAPGKGATSGKGAASGKEVAKAMSETLSLVRKLTRDPSLRATESGRTLLRMLLAAEAVTLRWEHISEAVPAHSVPLVRSVLLKFCDDWKRLADRVPQHIS
ncbi:StrR protein [[Actinomadura] parvosata subsp. kistnae]|uniref:ParB/RepB/Spo0J family partition protein n=1 Tax=[Actinomadura] parvosata TaxID=1955412 RepID=UPI000D2853F6|nr:ParB/RepB/Spo0J family partition protein [Nonomuraea sp. ATCC 55076]SPL99122.1 StrR protein [Actinomadura parvosata subsp. kistnae]